MKNIDELQYVIGFKPENVSIFELALTHPSYNSNAKTKHHDYERLEYIGDAVIGFISADLIFKLHPQMEPGNMTKLRSILVKTNALASYARKLGLVEFIRTGNSITFEQLNKSEHILENIFESLTGAIYLEKGIEFTYGFVKQFLNDSIINYDVEDLTDYKSKLQEEMQAEYRDSVHYELINQIGPAHDRIFTVQVLFNEIVLAEGTGKSKKAAEEDAARKALQKRRVL